MTTAAAKVIDLAAGAPGERLRRRFHDLHAARRKGLIPFITAGDPHADATVSLMHTLVEAGADVLELGVPFTDPIADGPVIQRASERALAGGMCLATVITMVAEFRQRDRTTPVVLMGYLNPVEAMGPEDFARCAAEAGVDAVLMVDVPPEEATLLAEVVRARGLEMIFLVAPTTTAARRDRICAIAGGFIYYVGLKGVTGSLHLDVEEVAPSVRDLRTRTRLPIAVGFGIRDAATATEAAKLGDAVVVGSALVECMEQAADAPRDRLCRRVAAFAADLRGALEQSCR